MTATISNIGKEITSIISSSKSIPSRISEQEKINHFLDCINNFKSKLIERSEKIKKLDDLFSKLTWHELNNQEDEQIVKELIKTAIKFHSKSIKNFVALKKSFWKDNICRIEISDYKNTLDDFEESIYEVEQIFFTLRKDDEFQDLMNSL
jgi:hypothetical protein